jgi:hypothetical protein
MRLTCILENNYKPEFGAFNLAKIKTSFTITAI